MKILSCGAGMQSTALALMSCENALRGITVFPLVPRYDAIFFCDLGLEPVWVYSQVRFIQKACKLANIPFYILKTDLYGALRENFGYKNVCSIPFWSVGPDGKKAKMLRHCTIDYKILAIQRRVRELLGYKRGQKTRPEDRAAHEMHIGFSLEERKRVSDSCHPMFVNCFPLIEMGWKREDSYKYILETWGLETKASACCFCPFHRNYFFQHIKENYPEDYLKIVELDRILEKMQPFTPIRSKLFISRSRKRIENLIPQDCNDAQVFQYNGVSIWNGF